MTWSLIVACVIVAVSIRACLGRVLRAIPAPADTADGTPYAHLATPGFQWATAGCVLGCCLIVAVTLGWPAAVAWLPLSTVGVVAAAIDARTTYLPRVLTLSATGAATACVVAVCLICNDWQPLLRASIGALVLGGLFWLLWALTRGFGFGDVRLAVLVGATAGTLDLAALLSSAFLGSIVGVVWGVAQRVSDRRRGRPPGAFAYGPSIVAGPYLFLTVSSLVGAWP